MRRAKRLGKGRTLYHSALYPARFAPQTGRYEALVGLGGNVGDVMRRFERLLFALRRIRGVGVLQTGAILKNPPFGYLSQDDFYNSVMRVTTRLQPLALLGLLLRLEQRFGRRRSFPNAPRTLDLDLIFFEGRRMNHPRLSLPHPHWHERESVLMPLQSLHVRGL
ncbi:MAG: 2-amino-4-hydroxy-6-hydroxymethyldihydropteridine diphosphokinase [Campylobacterales bacterium]|nr:2-amino-4-hydroxy-6-hydroxymethyldihydropteridine diphosphokinase [Campylobacterales bacterium]